MTNNSYDKPLQFTLRTLLLATAVVAVLVVICQRVGAVWGASLIWFLVLVSAHVVANARGSRGRGPGPSDPDQPADSADGDQAAAQQRVAQAHRQDPSKHAAPITRLGVCHGPAGRVLLCVITVGSAIGATVGTIGLVFLTDADTVGILLGVISAAVLGGILGFACGSFVLVMSRAFSEAVQDPHIVAAYRRGELA